MVHANRPEGSKLVRTCWCSQCKKTCPVYVLGAFFRYCFRYCLAHVACYCASRSIEPDRPAFPFITASAANASLRAVLKAIGVEDSQNYRSHDLRRGHAQDMAEHGSSLYDILCAGEWRLAITSNVYLLNILLCGTGPDRWMLIFKKTE